MNDRQWRTVSVVAVALLLGLLLYLAYVVRAALLLIFVGIIFAVIFAPWVDAIQRWHVRRWSPSRGAAVLILIGMVLAGISVFLTFAVPPIARDASQLTQELPQNLQGLQQRIEQLPMGDSVAEYFSEDSLLRWLQGALRQVFSIFHGVAKGLLALLTLALLTAYFILDGQRAFGWAMKLAPADRRKRLTSTLRRSAHRMQRWLYGQLMLMLILGSASTLVFGLLGVRYFYALGVFAGLANFVPILGPIATVVVAGIVAALDSWFKVLGVLIFYLVYQQIENAYLTPRIMRSAVNLPGVAVIVALTIGGELAGLLGAIVAVPTAALVATVINEYLLDNRVPALEGSEEAA